MTDVEKWTGFGLGILESLLALDLRSPERKKKIAESHAADLKAEAKRILRDEMATATGRRWKRLSRRRNRLLNRMRFWNARAKGFEDA
jgi:hypothetical protein